MRRAEYEQRVLQELRRILLGPGGEPKRFKDRGYRKIQVEDVRLDESKPEHELIILFRDLTRPECLFGFNMEAVERGQLIGPDDAHTFYTTLEDAAQGWTIVVWANFQERIIGEPLPTDCLPDETTWV
ncbi:MAG TPA: hypothetical protein VFJ72_15465 [Rubrobacteraceae bacterium]|nr:hypothetical protein [Rubrobacteraceae bacterium]